MGSNIYLQKICEQCGKEFTARTTVTRFCSHTCSSRAYKDRTRKDKVEKIKTDTIRIKTKEIREIQARDVLTVSEVAALVGCSRRTAYRLAATGTIKSANLGQRLTRIRRSEVDSFLSLPAKPAPQEKEYEISECYTVGEALRTFGISDKTLRDILKRNGIPKFQRGKFVYIPKKLLNDIFN